MDSIFWKLPTALPVIIIVTILLLFGCVCVITQIYCTQKITLGWPDPMKRRSDALSDVTLKSFHDLIGKSSRPAIPSTYFGKIIIVIAIFISIPVFELTSYHLTVSNNNKMSRVKNQ